MTKRVQKRWAICLLLLCIVTSAAAQSQLTKPRVQTSAAPEQTTVYKGEGVQQKKQQDASLTTAKKQPSAPQVGKAAAKKQPQGGKAVAKKQPQKGKKVAAKKESTEMVAGRYMALKSNLAYDAFALMNLSFEMQVHPKMSVELPVMWSLWDMEQKHGLRAVALQPEARWWMGSQVGKGHYFGLHGHVAWYNVKWNDNRYQDQDRPLLGAGLSYGYKLPLGEHWGAEFSLGVGYANMKYNTYYNIDNGAKIDTRLRHYWGVTRLGASLVYRF